VYALGSAPARRTATRVLERGRRAEFAYCEEMDRTVRYVLANNAPITTTHSAPSDRMRPVEAAFDHHLAKPVVPVGLFRLWSKKQPCGIPVFRDRAARRGNGRRAEEVVGGGRRPATGLRDRRNRSTTCCT
jgi:acetyl esterase/lipase